MITKNQFLNEESAPIRVLFAASEVHPLIKTGGLADVAGSLPIAMHHRNIEVRLILPAYPAVTEKLAPLHAVAALRIPGWGGQVRILEGRFKGQIPIYLVDIPGLFDRPGNPYVNANGVDWKDNADRFAAFCRTVVALAMKQTPLDWHPTIIHCNDWQTGLIPALLSQEWDRPATLFTIHNLSYQGLFDHATFQRLRLPPNLWGHKGVEFHDQLSFLKSGLAFADRITTVSHTYSEEILTPEFGYGLEGLLAHRAEHLIGILNGIDHSLWNPQTDPAIASNYSAENFQAKADNKVALQKELGLKPDSDALLLGHIGRIVPQKGIDLIVENIPRIIERGRIQLAVLGTGDPVLEKALVEAAAAHPETIAARITYSEDLSHRIEAGSDAFLMPSRYEPCGLNQLFSLRYGTPPIVHRTGGLADTVIDASGIPLAEGRANGFVFEEATSDALWEAIQSVDNFYRRPKIWWEKLALNGMKSDFSWDRSAEAYQKVYLDAIAQPLTNPLA